MVDILASLTRLNPDANFVRSTPFGGPIIPTPTADQLAVATADATAIESARAQILAAFTALPRGVQAFFDPVRSAVDVAISARDWQGVRDIIATTPAPTADLETTREQFATLVAQLLPAP